MCCNYGRKDKMQSIRNRKLRSRSSSGSNIEEIKQIYSLFSLNNFKTYMDIHNYNINLPPHVDYKGSFFAWGTSSVFTDRVYSDEPFPRSIIVALCLLPFLNALIILLAIIFLCVVPFVILTFFSHVIAMIRNRTFNVYDVHRHVNSGNYWKELTHF